MAHQYFSEDYNGEKRNPCNSKIDRGLQPENRDIQKEISEGSASDGCDQTDGICSEKIKMLHGCETDTAYRKSYRSNNLYDEEKECIYVHSVNIKKRCKISEIL